MACSFFSFARSRGVSSGGSIAVLGVEAPVDRIAGDNRTIVLLKLHAADDNALHAAFFPGVKALLVAFEPVFEGLVAVGENPKFHNGLLSDLSVKFIA